MFCSKVDKCTNDALDYDDDDDVDEMTVMMTVRIMIVEGNSDVDTCGDDSR